MDTRSAEQRPRIMQSVKQKDTGPEIRARKILHAMGYRFRLHRKDLPGRPDIVLPSKRKVIFVHGCFWHGHNCSKGRLPKSSLDYWKPKIKANNQRDERVVAELAAAGFDVETVWQCQVGDIEALSSRLKNFLG